MTKNRIYHDGEVEWLQYLHVRKWWFDEWRLVRSDRWDYWDEQWEVHDKRYGNNPSDGGLNFRYINSSNTNIQKFVKEYPDIDVWIKKRNHIVGEKRRKEYEARSAKESAIAKNMGKVTNL